MKKIILDFSDVASIEEIHNYLAETLCLPDYYGHNLDALHDCLTEISTPTCIGVFNSDSEYLERVNQVFKDSEEENPNICFIFSKLEQNNE